MADKPDELDCWQNATPICPHCGEAFDLGKSDRSHDISYEDGGSTEFDCDSCDKPFVVVTTVVFRYSTAVDDEHASDEMWGYREPETELEATAEI